MSSTPRIALDERAQSMFGITDPLPMYDPEFVRLVRETIALAYGATTLDRSHWDMLRVDMAERVDCGVCRQMRDVNAAPVATGDDEPAHLLIRLADCFHSPDADVPDPLWAELGKHFSDQAVAEALLGPIFGSFHPKVVVTCGLEPAGASDITNTQFDAARYSIEEGAIGMIVTGNSPGDGDRPDAGAASAPG